jgi:dTDP-4-dehydrorhamnose 3,5-epimerase
MIFTSLPLKGLQLIAPEPVADERGFFARTWCRREFEEHGLDVFEAQRSVSFNKKAGTVRGMHYQIAPHGENKLVSCTRGAIFDVAIDLRPGSATFGQHVSAVLSAENHHALYIPKGFAHGFQTLEDDTEVSYAISAFYQPGAASGIRWNDPELGIAWPLDVSVMSSRDAELPLLQDVNRADFS